MAKSAYEKVYESLKKAIQKTDTSNFEGFFAFQFNVTGDAAGTFYAKFQKGDSKITVENFSYDDHTAIFEADAATFTALVDGTLTPANALKKGKLAVIDNEPGCADIFNAIAPKKAAAKKTAAKKETAPKAAAAKKETAPKAAAKKAAPKAPAAKKASAKKVEAPKTEAPKAEAKAETKSEAPKAKK